MHIHEPPLISYKFHSCRVVVLGDDKGELFVWEDDLFNRRLNSTNEEEDDTRRSMRDRLKALRKR